MFRKIVPVLALLIFALPAYPAARLTYQLNGVAVPVSWETSAFPLRYAIDRRIVAAKPEMESVIARAFAEWSAVDDASLTFAPAGVVDGARPGKDGQNSISVADDLFRDQHFLAVTTNWYDDRGHLAEADIQIDAGTLTGSCDFQQLVAHEVGHMLGLDHSGVLSSVMYPYVGKVGAQALDSDESIAISELYPKINRGEGGATLSGRVIGDGGPIFAAQVVALGPNGEPVASALTDPQGNFSLDGIPAGTYRLYAEPLDGPVDVQNLSGVWRNAKVKSFPTQFADGGAIAVQGGKVYGNLMLNVSGIVQLNPKWIGASAPDASDVSLAAAPVLVHAGDTISLAVGGDGFTSGMTTFEIPSPSFHRVSDFRYASNYVSATYRIDSDVAAGSAVVLVKSGNESAALTGALRVAAKTRLRVARK
jgi:hypothetical protein